MPDAFLEEQRQLSSCMRPVVELPAVTFRGVIAMDPLRKIHCRCEAHRFERCANRNRGGEKTRRSHLLARRSARHTSGMTMAMSSTSNGASTELRGHDEDFA
jgi:hypothetical protein